MKKLFLIILICTVLSLSFAVAEQDSKEIMFRGIPWGSNYPDVMDSLSNWDLQFSAGEITRGQFSSTLAFDGSGGNEYDYKCGYYVESAYNSTTEVAGYEVKDVLLCFAFIPNSNGKIDYSTSNTSFYFARYHIRPLDEWAVYKDLKQKLSSVYGEPQKEETDEFMIRTDTCIWEGENDAIVELILVTSSYSSRFKPSVYISYCWNKGDKLMGEAEKLLHQEELDKEAEKYGTENTDGL